MIDVNLYLIIGAVALLLDSFIPDFSFVWKYLKHPVVILGNLISMFEKILYKKSFFRGLIMWILIVSIWASIGLLIEYVIFNYTDYGVIISLIILIISLASFALKNAVKKIMINIDKKNIKKSRFYTSHLCSRDTNKMNYNQCASTAIESLAENLSDGVIAPVLFYSFFGLTGLFAYKAINTLDSMVGYKSDKYKKFGFVSAKLDDVANYIPARISMVIIVIASFFHSKSSTMGMLGIIRKYANTHISPNAGYPESAFAGALKIRIGGVRTYKSIGCVNHWIGDGNKNISPEIIYNALGLFNWTIFIAFLFLISTGLYLITYF